MLSISWQYLHLALSANFILNIYIGKLLIGVLYYVAKFTI